MLSLSGYQIMLHFHKLQPDYIPAKEYGRMPVKEREFHRLSVYILNCSHGTIESGRNRYSHILPLLLSANKNENQTHKGFQRFSVHQMILQAE